ncbi:MAG: hypothetical protein AAGC58_10715 [Asticcacaulis sp.]
MKDTLISLGLISLMITLFIITVLSSGHGTISLNESVPIIAALLMIAAIISSHRANKH